MNIPKFSVEHSLAVNLLSGLILLSGLVVVFQIPREAFPNVNYGFVTVETVYRGSTPKEVEKLITIPIEDELRDVDGIDEITSTSLEGFSLIFIRLDLNAKNQDRVVSDIQRAVDRVADLPDEADDPVVEEVNTQDEPILIISLSGPDIWEVRSYAKELEDYLEDIPGVARVDKLGWKKTQIWVSLDPEKLAGYYLSFDDVARSLRAHNANIPGGKIYLDGEQHVVRTLGEFETPEEIKKVIIRANDRGNWLTVSDVADVRYALEDSDRIDRTNGQRAVNLSVVKSERADTLKLVKRVTDSIGQFKKRLPKDISLVKIEDLTLKYVRRRLSILTNNGIVGSILLTLVMLLFLGPRVAVLTTFGIPISFCITALYMWKIGMTINLIAMFGLVMVLGMLVDDAIIVAENSYRYMEQGMRPREATIRGTSEVIAPVSATILTTCMFFGSLLFMSGLMGKFVWIIPAVVIVSLGASLFESIVVLPSHIADFAGSAPARIGVMARRLEKRLWFRRWRDGYLRILKGAIRRRWWVCGGILIVAIASITLATTKMKVVLFPARGVEIFYIRAEAPSGTSLEQVEELLKPVEEVVAQLPPHELDHFITTIGVIQDNPGDPMQRRGTNLGQIQVFLKNASGRKREAAEIIKELRGKIDKIKELDLAFEQIRTGPPVGKAVEAHIRGNDFHVLEKIAEEFKGFLSGIPGVKDIRDNYEPGKPEFRILVDEQAARRARVGIADVGRAIRYAYEGIPATSIKRTDEEIDVLVRFPKGSRRDLSTLENVMVQNDRGDLVPLRRIVRFAKGPGVSYITHLDHKRSITVTAGVDEKQVTSFEANQQLMKRFRDIPERYPGYSVRYGGEQEKTMESFHDFFRAFVISVVACYAILAITFNSLLHPLLIFMAIPLGLIGIVCAFFIHDLPLSFMTMLGAIGLGGVVLNDAIVLVSFILQQLRQGRSMLRAIMAAGRLRFRPVILTTLSTAVALAPVAYGIGGLDPFLQPAALAMTWGLVFATTLTLIVIPCLYAIEDDVKRYLARARKQRAGAVRLA